MEKGYGESNPIGWMKLEGLKDWELRPIILEGDWTFVTKDRPPAKPAVERGRAGTLGRHHPYRTRNSSAVSSRKASSAWRSLA
ncbi:hypothetical protein GOL26_05485 [Sinorhizobium medicae]|nr:hypothetical protein [Sinorhizobium medicae]MDX1178255.1 hypothetical protein [Sinorhizobium medicae]